MRLFRLARRTNSGAASSGSSSAATKHVRVDEFVVTDSVADRTGQHDVAGPGSVDQSGHPEHRIGTELQRIQEGVINAPIDDVDLALPLGGAHVYLVVSTEQVAALDQFDTHLPGQQ